MNFTNKHAHMTIEGNIHKKYFNTWLMDPKHVNTHLKHSNYPEYK